MGQPRHLKHLRNNLFVSRLISELPLSNTSCRDHLVQIENKYAVVIDIALVKPEGLRQAKADLATQSIGHYAAAAVTASFTCGIGVHFGTFALGSHADRLSVIFEEQNICRRTSHRLVRKAADHDLAVRIHRRVERRPARPGCITRALNPSSFRFLNIRFEHENERIIVSRLCQE